MASTSTVKRSPGAKSASRVRMDAMDRREQLLDTIRDIVATEGFHAATIDRVAREASVTRALIYTQFGDLPGMIKALIDRETGLAMAGLLQVLVPPPKGSAPLQIALTAMQAMLEATSRVPLSWRILLNPPQGGPIELYDRIAAGRMMFRKNMQELVVRAIATPIADTELSVHLVHLASEELVRLHLNDPKNYPAQRVMVQYESLLRAFIP